MIVAVIMVARVAVLVMMVIVSMRMIVATTLRMMGVRTLLRVERRFDGRKPGAESTQHVFDHVIATNAQPIADDLNFDMSVADVPGEPRQCVAVVGGDFDQSLDAADDTHNAAVVEHETIAVAQRHRLRQIEQKGRALLAVQHDAPALPLICIEQDLVDRTGAVPVACCLDCLRAFHLAHDA
jgi:hypothetical protein